MKRKSILLSFAILMIIMLGLNSSVYAQQTTMRFMVSFTDKVGTPWPLTFPKAFLSLRAIERRAKFKILVTEADLPVSLAYLDTISASGIKVVGTSRWLNAALIEVDDSLPAMDLLSFPFVTAVDLLYYKVAGSKGQTPFNGMKSIEGGTLADLLSGHTAMAGVSSGINYGAAFAQANMLGATYLHTLGYKGDSVQIAVLDAGFMFADTMPAFDSLRSNNKILSTRNIVNPLQSVYSSHLHGTMVLSTLGGNIPGSIVGTAPEASYHLIRTEDGSSEFPVEEFYWAMGAEYADSIGADVINSSLGYTTFDLPLLDHTFSSMDGKTSLSSRAATFAAARGMLVVASAGNGGGSPWYIISSPGDADSIITVGAVDATGQYAPFSSTGNTADNRIKPDVAAVGWNAAYAEIGGVGVALGNGTSFSSPILCGAVACLWQANPNISNQRIIDAVRRSAHQYYFPDTLLGYGIPNLAIAHLILGGQEIPDLNQDKKFKIAPNPFNDMMLLTFFASDTQKVNVSLYDIRGKLLHERVVQKNTGVNVVPFNDLQRLSAGTYILRIIDGNQVITEKVIKR